jgi:hypothetical protein
MGREMHRRAGPAVAGSIQTFRRVGIDVARPERPGRPRSQAPD